jgi:hypothetical protein
MVVEVLLVMAGLMLATVGQWIAFDQTAPFFQAFSTHTKHEWVSRITSGIVQLLLIGFATIQGRTSLWGSSLILGYFLHDTGHMLTYETDITSYIHHIVATTVFGLTKLAMTPAQADLSTSVMALLESTSPVLHVTWLLKQAGYGGVPWFKWIAGFAAVFFGFMRIGVFSWVIATKMDRVSTVVFAPLLGLNVYWFWKIVTMARRVLERKEEPASCSEPVQGA